MYSKQKTYKLMIVFRGRIQQEQKFPTGSLEPISRLEPDLKK